jgi:hypothetical protein
MYVQYADLVQAPVDVMRAVFTHLELEAVDVDSDNVVKAQVEHDHAYGIYGSHAVRNTVSRRGDEK